MDSRLNTEEDLDNYNRVQLLSQIAELQAAVSDMKNSFTGALQQLGNIQYEDQNLNEKINQNKAECQDQIGEVIKLMLSLKSKFCCLKDQMQRIQHQQQTSQMQVQSVLFKQNLLLAELCRSGIISENIKQQLMCSHTPVERTSSGCHSSDSGVALLLEKAHTAFQLTSPTDQDAVSVSETSPTAVQNFMPDYACDSQPSGYDSDSSLVMAANKSLSLSTSLGKQCGLELDNFDSSSEDGEFLMEDVDSDLMKNENDSLPQPIIKPSSTSSDVKNCPGSKCTKSQSNLIKNKDYRDNQRLQVLTDFLETEKVYCKALSTLQDTFAEPLKLKNIVSMRDINTIFPEDVYYIYEKHCILLHKLEERYQIWKWNDTIGDILVRFINPGETDILRWYTSYVNDFPEVLKTFHKLCRQSGSFTKFLKTCLNQPNCKNSDLGSFLLAPLQRIPNYVLLIKRLQMFTDSNHSDSNTLSAVLNRLNEFLSRLNDSMEHSFQLVTAQMNPQTEIDSTMCSEAINLGLQKENDTDALPVKNKLPDCDHEIVGLSLNDVSCSKSIPRSTKPLNRLSCWEVPERNAHGNELSSRCCSSSECIPHSKFTKFASAANLPSTCSCCMSHSNLKIQRYLSDDMTDGCWQKKSREQNSFEFRSHNERDSPLSHSSPSTKRNEFRESEEDFLDQACGTCETEAINSKLCSPSKLGDLPHTRSKLNPPLSKSRSAHAVHEVVEANNQWLDEIGRERMRPVEKSPGQTEKKKMTLRALKNLWFFKKRHNGPSLRQMDIGAYKSHDALFPVANDEKVFSDRRIQ